MIYSQIFKEAHSMYKRNPQVVIPLPDLLHDHTASDIDNHRASHIDNEIRKALQTAQDLAARCRQALGDRVAGIYLHGSLAMGGFNPASSDIDLLVVVSGDPAREELLKLSRLTLDLHATLPTGRNIEYTVVKKEGLQSVVCPTPAVYHYSSLHRPRYEENPDYLCAYYDDPDLASQIVVAYERGFVLYGKPLRTCMPAVPREAYLRSILHDVADAEAAIGDAAMYVTLNLCRVLLFLTQGHVASKREGGLWGVFALPEWQFVIQAARDAYTGATNGPISISQEVLVDFAQDLLKRIEEAQAEEEI
ncbi:hypothetical protein B9G55_13255 [Saccharibacillus sp. O16]|nr:hypothetical protein B9G55_13255 [Saccharibacillus sp. O16]